MRKWLRHLSLHWYAPGKLHLGMRLTIVLVIIGCLHAGAKGVSQTITLHRINSPLETVLNDIHRQSGYSFVYNLEWLAKVPKVTLTVEQATLTETLDQLLVGQPLSYTLIDKTVVLRWQPKPPPVPDPVSETVEGHSGGEQVTMFVRNMQGQALAGASVYFKRTRKGTITGANGEFNMTKLTVEDTLVVSYIGYKTRNVSIGNLVQTTFPVILMTESEDKLDQMVVQAYGTTSARLSTGNITKVSGEEIAKQPISNPILALEGRVAGLNVQATNAYGSAPVKLEIRGRSSLNPQFTSEPLIIIDGIQMNALDADGISSYASGSMGMVQNGLITPAGGQSPFYGLTAADIESISVLKDASATSLYGSRGGNGVILITTKRGRADVTGATRVTGDFKQGVSRPTGHWDLLGTKDYLAMRREAYANDGRTPTIFDAPDLLLWDTTRNVDWQHELYGGHKAMFMNAHLALSGGDVRNQFYLSGTYGRQRDLLQLSKGDRTANLDFSITHHSLDNKLAISLGGNYLYNAIDNLYSTGGTLLPPNTPPIFNSKGELNFAPWDSAGMGSNFPFALLKRPYSGRSFALTSNLRFSYQIVRGLVAEILFTYRKSGLKQVTLFPKTSMDPAYNQSPYAFFGDNDFSQYSIEPQLSYNRYLGPGQLSVITGATVQRGVSDGVSQYALGYTSDAMLSSVQNAATVMPFESYAEKKIAGIYLKLGYNVSNKYIVDLAARRDGSSRFGPGKQYGNFGSAGIAWMATEEKWLRNVLPKAISFLKFRASYGIVGSDGISDYQYLSQWMTSLGGTQLYSYGGVIPLASQHAVNQEYHWQSTKTSEIGMDISMLKNSLSFSMAYYRKRCDNQLTSYPTPLFTGFNSVVANWPANVQNAGLEFGLSGKAGRNEGFNWNGSFNISFNSNKLLAYDDIGHSPYVSKYIVGKPLNSIPLFHWTGIDPATGKNTYQDYDHDGTIRGDYSGQPGTNGDDRGIFLNMDPKFFGGMTHSFGYKGFGLMLAFSYYKQMGQNAFLSGQANGGMQNISPVAYRNRWQKPGDKAQFTRLTTVYDLTDSYFPASDGIYSDASYIRLKTLDLSYKLPEPVLRKLKAMSCVVYIQASNLFTITGYKGQDPSIPYFGAMPTQRTIVGGINFTF